MESSDEPGVHIRLPRFVCNALYVTDLDPDFVSNDILLRLFGQVGTVLSVKLCPNAKSAGELSYAYINYSTTEEACVAWRRLNYKRLNGIPMRILFSNLDSASRYNQDANLIISNLEESIDSEFLHHTFSVIGVVISCKVRLDNSRKSLGHGFIQFQDEEDAQSAIRLVNGKLLQGKQVYVGPLIPRPRDRALDPTMDWNPRDLNLAHSNTMSKLKLGVHLETIIDEASLCSSSSNSNIDDENDSVESRSDHGAETCSHESVAFKARAAEMIQRARDSIIVLRRLSTPHIDLSYVPSSEPWAPQPWSVETLRANLARAHLPEERRAMLNSTLLPLVWTCTKDYTSTITDELIKSTDIEEIGHLMESSKALQRKVQATTAMIVERIRDQPPFVPMSALALATPKIAPSTPELTDVDPITPTKLPVFQVGTGVFHGTKATNFRHGTGFFDPDVNEIGQICFKISAIAAATSQPSEFRCQVSHQGKPVAPLGWPPSLLEGN